MKILVLGSSGFIGSNLVERKMKQGHKVVGVDIQEPKYIKPDYFLNLDLKESYTYGQIDLLGPYYDEVYQLAADMGGAGFIFTGENDAEVMYNSALINLNVANYAKKTKVGKLFYSSSVCAYSIEQVRQRIPEEAIYPANPDSNYGWEKIFSERLYQAFAKNKGLNIRIARFNNCFGPYSTWSGGREKSPAAICRKAITQNPIEIWGDGKQVREFIYIDDLLDAIQVIMDSNHTEPINIGPDESYTIDEMVRMVSDKEIKHVPSNAVGLQVRLTDNTKIKSLGWKPKVSVPEGMKRLYSWIEGQISQS